MGFMRSPDYVWEKMYVALDCLCGEGSFRKRLEGATVSALIRLGEDDADGELGEELRYILDRTKNNMIDGKLVREPDGDERRKLTHNMLHVMSEAYHRAERRAERG